MKVICINDSKDVLGFADYSSGWRIKEGDIYTVYREESCLGVDGSMELSYSLIEDPDRELYSWPRYRFIPLSSIDETQFERNYNKELA